MMDCMGADSWLNQFHSTAESFVLNLFWNFQDKVFQIETISNSLMLPRSSATILVRFILLRSSQILLFVADAVISNNVLPKMVSALTVAQYHDLDVSKAAVTLTNDFDTIDGRIQILRNLVSVWGCESSPKSEQWVSSDFWMTILENVLLSWIALRQWQSG